jgi:hypothetical protein
VHSSPSPRFRTQTILRSAHPLAVLLSPRRLVAYTVLPLLHCCSALCRLPRGPTAGVFPQLCLLGCHRTAFTRACALSALTHEVLRAPALWALVVRAIHGRERKIWLASGGKGHRAGAHPVLRLCSRSRWRVSECVNGGVGE